jgi:hypothetical protein
MKITARFSFCAVFLLILTVPIIAQNSGPSANGDFQFSAGGHPLSVQFDARKQNNGSTRGQMTLSGSVNVPEQDVDGEGASSGESLVSVSIQVDVDCLAVSGSGAVLSGEISDANVPAYIGRRALLAVVDNGEGVKAPARDQFMWGLYATPEMTWVASDGELEFDPGVGLTWLATDFEREDDAGIPSNPSTTVDCHSFPAGSYSFEDLPLGGGNIQVRP